MITEKRIKKKRREKEKRILEGFWLIWLQTIF